MREAVFLLVCAGLVSGCAGPMFEGTIFEQPTRTNKEMANVVSNTQQMNLEFRQLSEQVAALSRNQELMESRLARLETQVNAAPKSQDDVVALRRDIQMIRTERETLKREITDDLAGRIEKIAARQQAEISAAKATSASPQVRAPAGRAASPATSSRGSGYEHKVERGQTLSEIARGYGKSVDAIMKANKITNPSNIRAGEVLFIPD